MVAVFRALGTVVEQLKTMWPNEIEPNVADQATGMTALLVAGGLRLHNIAKQLMSWDTVEWNVVGYDGFTPWSRHAKMMEELMDTDVGKKEKVRELVYESDGFPGIPGVPLIVRGRMDKIDPPEWLQQDMKDMEKDKVVHRFAPWVYHLGLTMGKVERAPPAGHETKLKLLVVVEPDAARKLDKDEDKAIAKL